MYQKKKTKTRMQKDKLEAEEDRTEWKEDDSLEET